MSLASNTEFIASSYSEDGEIYFVYNNSNIERKYIKQSNFILRIESMQKNTSFFKSIHDLFHTINCTNTTNCQLSTSPYGKSCVSIIPKEDMNYAIIIKRHVKLSNIIQFILAVVLLVKASKILKYKQIILFPFFLFSGILIGYIISLENKMNRNDTIGIIINNIIEIKNNIIIPYFNFTDYVNIICFIILAIVISLLLSVDFVYLWIIRYIGLCLIFNSISSVVYGSFITLIMLSYIIIFDYYYK